MASEISGTDLQTIFDRTAQTLCNLGWNIALLFLHHGSNPAAGPIVTAACDPELRASLLANPAHQLFPEKWRQPHYRISRSYLAVSEDDRLPQDTWQANDLLIIPVEMGGEELGWFSVCDPRSGTRPTLDEIYVLELVADQTALLIEQARICQQALEQVARLTLLNDIAHTISQYQEMAEVFTAITAYLRKVFPFQRASIILREGMRPQSRILVHDTQQPTDSESPALTALENIAFSRIIQQNEPYRIAADLSTLDELDEESQLYQQGIRSYACLPLTVWGQTIGVFSLAAQLPGAFCPEDAGNLLQIAAHVSGGVWNGLLYELEQRRRYLADALAQLAETINSTLELDQVLELALEQLGRVITYDTASILLLEGDTLRITACHGFEDPPSLIGTVFRLEEQNISHRVIFSQKVRVVGDVQQLPEWGHHRGDIEAFERIRAWIGAPLIVRGMSIGLLVLDKLEPDFYTDEDGETAAAFAAQIATAVQNASLYHNIQQQRNRLASILTDTTDAIIVLNESGRVWLINPAAERSLNSTHAELAGQPITELGLPELAAALDRATSAKQPARIEISRPDGSIFNASIAPVRDVGWVIVMQDITPLKELDRLRTEWVAAVSHDLKNPIQMVQLGAALLETDGPLTEVQLERVQIILRGAEQLRNLVTNVLDLARLEAGPSLHMAPLNLSDVIAASLADVEHLAVRKQQQLLYQPLSPSPVLQGDEALLQRALVNLLTNAIKYTPDEGLIAVRTRVQKRSVLVDIMDNGPGMPAEALPLLFKRFYRAPGTSAEGTGLGLSIVKSIIDKHKGSIRVESAEGKGSTFTVVLPVTKSV